MGRIDSAESSFLEAEVYLPFGEGGNLIYLGEIESDGRSLAGTGLGDKLVEIILAATDGDDIDTVLDEPLGQLKADTAGSTNYKGFPVREGHCWWRPWLRCPGFGKIGLALGWILAPILVCKLISECLFLGSQDASHTIAVG